MIDDYIIAKKLISIKNSAKDRNIEFDMSFKKIKKLLNKKKCFFSGVLFDELDNKLSFDRIDNNLGYIDSNVVSCIMKINSMKANLTIENIEMLYKGIIKHNKKKS